MQHIQKWILLVAKSIFITVSMLSIALFLFSTYMLHVQRVPLKSGKFELSNNEFEFNGPGNDEYYIKLKFMKGEMKDLLNARLREFDYAITINLTSADGKLLSSDYLTPKSHMPKSYAQDYFDWALLRFKARKGTDYKLSLSIKSYDRILDQSRKEIYIEEVHDYAADPWYIVLKTLSLAVFIISFLVLFILETWSRYRKISKS